MSDSFQGDQEINKKKLEDLYKLYESKLYIAAYSILHNAEQAEDAVHDTFVKLIPHLEQIEEAESKKTQRFVVITLKNSAIDMYRKNGQENALFQKGIPEHQEEALSFGDISENSIEKQQILKDILEHLLPKYRDVIKRMCFYGFTAKETAVQLQISEDAVRKRFSRAKDMIRKMIGDELVG